MNRAANERGLTEMPVQRPAFPPTAVAERARFFNSGNAFNIQHAPVPPAIFVTERDEALAAAGTRSIACDQSAAFGASFPASTPLMLARYAAIAPRATYSGNFVATGVIWYVVRGSGEARVGDEHFTWGRGDVFLTPGAAETRLAASAEGAVLWFVTNEPQLSFDGLVPAVGIERLIDAVHYPAAEIAHQLERIRHAKQDDSTAGRALIFSGERQEHSRNIMPSLTLSLNTVPAGERQRSHRHNSAALTLILKGERCYSMVAGRRCDWSAHATLVTPATEPHSHHNEGDEEALFLIVQDGGFHYHARTMGFSFLEPQADV